MRHADHPSHDSPARAASLGALVLGATVLLSNLRSLGISPGEAILDRLAVHVIAQATTVGFFAQLATGIWLSLALLLDVRRGRRLAAVLWVVSVALYLAPLPPLAADLALGPASMTVAAAFALLARALLADA